MAAELHTVLDAGDGKLRGAEPQENQIENVPSFDEVADLRGCVRSLRVNAIHS